MTDVVLVDALRTPVAAILRWLERFYLRDGLCGEFFVKDSFVMYDC